MGMMCEEVGPVFDGVDLWERVCVLLDTSYMCVLGVYGGSPAP